MLTYLELTNFMSFSNLCLDLRRAHGEPKKVVFIYGENGSGKSNLMSSMLFLRQSLNTLINQEKLRNTSALSNEIINVITDEKMQNQLLNSILHSQFYTLSDIIEDCIMIGTQESMTLKYGFRLNEVDGSYLMEFFENKIIREELRYQINEREGVLFSLSKDTILLSPSIFFDGSYRKELFSEIEKYWGKNTFMSILMSEIKFKNVEYVKARVNKNIFDVTDWLNRFSIWCKQSHGETAHIAIPYNFMRQLEKGTIKTRADKELKLFEAVLNTFFTQLYTDIKLAYYVITPKNGEFSYELYFKKQIDGHLLDIPFSLESTGTKKLLEIFPMLFSGVAGESVFVDEIDSGIHDLLMKSILEQLEESSVGQLIATTHNTLLMESLKPENTYIIRMNANGKKTVDCISAYGERTQKNHSIRNKYLRGDYEGIPYTGYVDFQELVDSVSNTHHSIEETDGEQA